MLSTELNTSTSSLFSSKIGHPPHGNFIKITSVSISKVLRGCLVHGTGYISRGYFLLLKKAHGKVPGPQVNSVFVDIIWLPSWICRTFQQEVRWVKKQGLKNQNQSVLSATWGATEDLLLGISYSCVSVYNTMLGGLQEAVLSRDKPQTSKRHHREQKAGPIFSCPVAQGPFWEPILLASARGCHPGKPALTGRLHYQKVPRPQLTGLSWPIFSVRAALIGLINPGDHMVLFNEDPNWPKSQFRQGTLENLSIAHWSISTEKKKSKAFAPGWSETA